jgi:hypothetical protein
LPGLMEALRERWAELEPPIRCARLQMFHRIPPDDHLSA